MRDIYVQVRFWKCIALVSTIALITLVTTLVLKDIAYAERGYDAVGGEFAPIALGLLFAFMVIDHTIRPPAKKKAVTDAEQKNKPHTLGNEEAA